jgi:hypothetical protein
MMSEERAPTFVPFIVNDAVAFQWFPNASFDKEYRDVV